MDVFSLNSDLIDQYSRFARSFTRIRSQEIQAKVDLLYGGRKFWPEPLLQLNPHYEPGGSIKSLVGKGGLTQECLDIFKDPRAAADDPDKSLKLRKHQAQAIGLALNGKSYVVTTGTGSGKSLCFFIPIIDAVIKAKKSGESPRTRAIIIYPMNALANSQMEELKKFLGEQQGSARVTFARYTGQEGSDERERIKNNPPDILLTNFMMLELLMTRQSELDQKVIENCKGLRFIVLDELHTYRGRQGADVAMLVRRLRSRVSENDRPPICIGTSATMASEGGPEAKNDAVAAVASQLFGTAITRDAVVTETLKRVTDPRKSADKGLSGLGKAVRAAAEGNPYRGKTNAQLGEDELAIWVETRLGLSDVDKKPQRASPRPLQVASALLSEQSGESVQVCEQALRNALLAYSLPEKDRGVPSGEDAPLFAFKLHQFISGAGRLYATLDPAGQRTVTFDGQVFDPENEAKRLYSTHFCRNCGQEHHPVSLEDVNGERRFEKREIDDVPLGDDEDEAADTSGRWGFLMPEPVDGEFTFDGNDADYPEAWLEQTNAGVYRLKAAFRKSRAELHSVRADGTIDVGGRRCWFMLGKFKFCPACGDHHSDSTRDINRLAALSAEGRSSATTIIISAILRWMNGESSAISPITRKLLAFTDNRQDAALQAGHFNDFVFVSLLRGAILGALQDSGEDGIQEDSVGQALQRLLGFVSGNKERRGEWLFEVDLKGANLINAEKAVRSALTHRFWIDQRRGWRYTNPNLEQLGLIEARYIALDELAADAAAFSRSDLLMGASAAERVSALKELLDTLRKGLAVECDALDRVKVESLAGGMRGVIKAPWAIDEDRIRAATVFMPNPPRRQDMSMADEELILRGSGTSSIGRRLRQMSFGGKKPTSKEVTSVIETLLHAASTYGLTTQMESPVGGTSWRVVGSAIAYVAADNPKPERNNPFFRDLYRKIADLLRNSGQALFGFEGREHTAQVEGELRELREARFRYGEEDQKVLKESNERLKELREDPRFLPTLFCSPTMELGVDISSMNVVYMRNVPPTPANYAQRGGRAGRSGQAALIVCYCAAQSPHDQYFFQRPAAVVDGIVIPPAIDLKNPDLVDSHLHAEWLSGSGAALSASIAENLDMNSPDKPLKQETWNQVTSDEAKREGLARVSSVLKALERDYGKAPPEWFSGGQRLAEVTVDAAPVRFAKTFDRWRDLLAAAEKQRDEAARILADYSVVGKDRKDAERRQSAANTQINLLLRGSEGQGTDFYVYRYMATEGFLPGYNFPRLPLMAFIPGGQGGKGQRYIQRARFLAVGEFGPGSLVYHEGRSYRVDRALLREAGAGDGGLLATFSTSICDACGAAHDGEPPETCHVCDHPLSGAEITKGLYRIENVGTRAVERITANDEERRRQGYELQTCFEFTGARDVRSRTLADDTGEIAYAKFAPAALVRRINRGLKRRSPSSGVGFWIEPKSGYWASAPKAGTPDEGARQRITPVVEDRKNTMLLRFSNKWLAELGEDREGVLATIQHALARGVEEVYQLEEGEIMVEPTPSSSNRRALLFYEAVEGGAGALSRLLDDREAFRRVALSALDIMHYSKASTEKAIKDGSGALESVEDARCVAACYRCLLSYFNQPDQELLDRRNEAVLSFLLRLAAAVPAADEAPSESDAKLDGCPPHDKDPLPVEGFEIRWIWRSARIAAVDHAGMPKKLEEKLTAKGIELVVLPPKGPERAEKIRSLAKMLGATSK